MSPQPSVDSSPQTGSSLYSPLEIFNLYFSEGKSAGNNNNRLWQKMNTLLSWKNILEHGYQTDLSPFLYVILNKEILKHDQQGNKKYIISNGFVSDAIFFQLKANYYKSLQRNLVLFEELRKVKEILCKINVQTVVLKGGYLAENVYKDIACRPMSDIDVLVRIEDLNKIDQSMHALGYRNVIENKAINTLHYSYYKNVFGQYVKFEFHHKLIKEIYPANFPYDEILNNNTIPTYFYICYLAWHATQHGIVRLIWLLDICQILRINNINFCFDKLIEESNILNVSNELEITLSLTKNMNIIPDKIDTSLIKKRFLFVNKLLFFYHKKYFKKKDLKLVRFILTLSLMRRKERLPFLFNYFKYKKVLFH